MPNTWWRGAAIYQVYLRSFADGNGDGVGDLAGLRSRLPYLTDLGVDAIWLNPWYPSPMADGGYDVADYRDIEPVFGTLAEAEAFIDRGARAGHQGHHRRGAEPQLRPPAPGSRRPCSRTRSTRDRFWFRDEPNDWQSIFGGPAWTQVPDGQWYLHLFAPEQPDFNWDNPEVHAGVPGRAAVLVRPRRRRRPHRLGGPAAQVRTPPYEDLDGVHDVYRRWRQVSDSYDERVLIGEVWLPDQERFARYLRPDELHTAFNFDFLSCPWDPAELRRVIDLTLATHAPVGAPPTWVLSNHDVTRPVTRYGRADTRFAHGDAPARHALRPRARLPPRPRRRAARHGPARRPLRLPGRGARPARGRGPARRAAPGPDVRPLRRHRPRPGRLPGAAALVGRRAPVRLRPRRTEPWLPQPESWRKLSAEAQHPDLDSMLNLYRAGAAPARARTWATGP